MRDYCRIQNHCACKALLQVFYNCRSALQARFARTGLFTTGARSLSTVIPAQAGIQSMCLCTMVEGMPD